MRLHPHARADRDVVVDHAAAADHRARADRAALAHERLVADDRLLADASRPRTRSRPRRRSRARRSASAAPTSPGAPERAARRGRLPSTAWSSIVQPAPITVPACTTTCAPNATPSPSCDVLAEQQAGARGRHRHELDSASGLARARSQADDVGGVGRARDAAQVDDEPRALGDRSWSTLGCAVTISARSASSSASSSGTLAQAEARRSSGTCGSW